MPRHFQVMVLGFIEMTLTVGVLKVKVGKTFFKLVNMVETIEIPVLLFGLICLAWFCVVFPLQNVRKFEHCTSDMSICHMNTQI